MSHPPLSIRSHFSSLKDPRRHHRQRHRLLDIVVIALCAVIAGSNTWQEVEAFGRERRDWLEGFLGLPGGTPSHDTFERLFERLDPVELQRCLLSWVRAASGELKVDHIAIDGKTLRHSGGPARGLEALHLVSAWATGHGLSLGQVAVEGKSNEITAIPRLLDLLKLKGALVTIDAMGCQKEIAKKIVEGGGDYVLTVKGNQGRLRDDIEAAVLKAINEGARGADYHSCQTEEDGHGRHEKRHYTIINNPQGIRDQAAWEGLKVVGVCYRERTEKGKTSEETVYFIGSRVMPVKRYGAALRGHWQIENGLHWQLDMTFREDASRIRRRTGAANASLLRKTALSMLRRDTRKGSIAVKRLRAALSSDFLEEILLGSHNMEKR
jgi:predicted transposase YbfD/YdcC